jgi:RNA polymerase sporulation-specific sigma factor
MKKVMNDYELIYLIQSNHDHIALDFLYHKYEKFIWKNVHLLNIDEKEFDDFFQEGNLMFLKAVKTFNEEKNKSFTRYFELILKRQFYYLVGRLPKYELNEELCLYLGANPVKEELLDIDFKSELEAQVYDLHFVNNKQIKEIASLLETDSKSIYNAIYRIKEKYKNML